MFTLPEHSETFRRFLTGGHANVSFAIEKDKQNRMSFPDVQIICEDKTFTNPLYWAPTFSGVSTHFERFLPSIYKFDTVYKLAYGCFRVY